MAEISKKDLNFLNDQEDKVKEALGIEDSEFSLISNPVASITAIRPGDVLSFVYRGSPFMAIAVSNERTGTRKARFTNFNTGNKLFSCFLVDQLSSESLRVLISSLDKYKDYSKIASYRYFVTLFGMFLGKQYYRTFLSTSGMMGSLKRIRAKGVKNGSSSTSRVSR